VLGHNGRGLRVDLITKILLVNGNFVERAADISLRALFARERCGNYAVANGL
jgi:hypothetical protein